MLQLRAASEHGALAIAYPIRGVDALKACFAEHVEASLTQPEHIQKHLKSMAPFSFAFTLGERKVCGDLAQAATSLEGRSIVQHPALLDADELPEAVDGMIALALAPPRR